MDEFRVTNDWLQARATASPRAIALMLEGRVYTFAQLDSIVSRLCGYLAKEGVSPNDHLAILMPNSLAIVCFVFAMARLGTVLVPLNTRLTPVELAHQIKRADCVRLYCSTTTEPAARSATTDRIPVHAWPDTAEAFENWLNRQKSGSFNDPVHGDLHSLQAIVFTSGTTGFPKGAMITYANHFWNAVGSAFRLGVQSDDRWLASLPIYHVGGLAVLFRSCLYGTTIILQNGFDTRAIMDSLKEEGVTLVSLVPTMLERLIDDGLNCRTAPTLRMILLGGAAATPELLTKASDAGLDVAVTYGLTEASSQVATMLPAGTDSKPGSVGRPLLFTQIKVFGENGREAPPDIPGEIIVSGPTVMAGYYGEPEATERVLDRGRLHTGDIGYFDQDGDLWVLDRRSDLIVSGGENVYPAEVERVLRAHPAVSAACVIGVPHRSWGRQVAAMVVLTQPGAITKMELLAYCRKHLAGYKQPRILVFADRLPLTGSGKIQRSLVAQQLAALAEPV